MPLFGRFFCDMAYSSLHDELVQQTIIRLSSKKGTKTDLSVVLKDKLFLRKKEVQ